MKPKTIFILFLLLFALSIHFSRAQNKKTNILIIIGDDCTYNDLPVYGGVNISTPNIDKLASEGLVFNNAYLTMSMCVPCRAELYSGRYPVTSGVCWNHSRAKSGIRGIGQYLGDLGYRVGLAGKTHAEPNSVYQFEMVDGVERDCVSKTAAFNPAGVYNFMIRDKNKPFCLSVAFTMPHAPWTVGNNEKFDPDKLKLPTYLADTKDTREDYIKYLAEIEELDRQIGTLLQLLEKSGEADNTIVLFTSEQGAQFPGCKWTNWNTGIHTGFVVRWPGIVQEGKHTNAIIQYCDVLPTLIKIAGGEVPSGEFDGSSFLQVLQNKTDKHRDFAYFMHNNIPEGPAYPIRSITDGTYLYIRNLAPVNIYIEKHMMGQMMWHKYWPSWIYETTENEHTNYLVNRFLVRPKEELYNTKNDPSNFYNLINDENLSKVKQQLSEALDIWMKNEGDPGADLDSWENLNASRQDKHKY